MGVSPRDLRILALARAKLGDRGATFDEACRVLAAAVAEVIPSGRIYLLGERAGAPIVGSIISRVGIVDGPDGVDIVRGDRVLGRFRR